MMVKKEHHWKLSDDSFEEQFATASLPIPWFTHAAHLRLAWIQLDRYGQETAIKNIRAQIKQFAQAAGEPDKYHETVTIAAILMVEHFMKQHKEAGSKAFLDAHPQLAKDFKGLIQSHYSRDIFKDQEARKVFLQPDLLPFD